MVRIMGVETYMSYLSKSHVPSAIFLRSLELLTTFSRDVSKVVIFSIVTFHC